MSQFPKFNQDQFPKVYLEDTDKDLPKKLDPNFRYALFTTIAKGGKSLIQSCKDMRLSRVICYKTLLPEFVNDEIEQKRLLREARVSAMLQHPNTVPTYEVGRTNKGYYYFTMKLVQGYTLREVLDYRERYDLSQLLDIIVQVAQALQYAHTHGVVHRDIKPENILVGPFGEVLLLDWGMAKVWPKQAQELGVDEDAELGEGVATEDETMTGFQKLQGTLAYMSPEQLEKHPGINGRTDVYSLAVILYELITGELPFKGERVDEVVAAIKNTEPQAPSSFETLLPVSSMLENLIMNCLDKDPARRVQKIGEMIMTLQQLR